MKISPPTTANRRASWLLLAIIASLQLPPASLGAPEDEPLGGRPVDTHYQRASIPGHYEFEVAPKLRPPKVRPAPYRQSGQTCPGSDPFAGFSPRDTLCGDLNQGRLPLNPMGQLVSGQTYPFELIKNKTMQFLARALPALKLEYDSIPKVGRYLASNELLNPTHLASPLGHEQMGLLNQQLAAGHTDAALLTAPYLRRRKRSPGGLGTMAAELSPNATLVVSSAHSAGRIHANRSGAPHSLLTRDGQRPLAASQQWAHLSVSGAQTAPATSGEQRAKSAATNNAAAAAQRQHPLASAELQARADGDTSAGSTTTAASPAPQQSAGQQQQPASSKSETGTRPKRQGCDSSSGFAAAICQAASALIEGDKSPSWLQLVKHLGNAYSGASDTMASPSIWSILSGIASPEPLSNAKSAPQSSGSGRLNLLQVLSSLASYLSGSSAKDSSSSAASSSGSVTHGQSGKMSAGEQQSPLASLASGGSSYLYKLALAGWASNAVAKFIDHIAPNALASAANYGFAKRKKTYDPQETYVDTPASLAALQAANSRSSQLNGPAAGKQPPTPCPSVEEYISPTFARNYQGAWKYVVQIPHEGYFTQTIQKTSCVRQKCEFTEGVCHESPRWVSLLVAEIYYPNAIFGQSSQAAAAAAGASSLEQANDIQQQQAAQLMASASTNNMNQIQMQQHQAKSLQSPDPMQMNDNSLNSLFINTANQLGLDPTNVAHMQQLGDAYNYQFLQRNGLLQQQQQQQQQQPQAQTVTAEPRSSNGLASQSAPQTFSLARQPQPTSNPMHSNDYIMALAYATLQQNPNMSIDDLIRSLQLTQHVRKRRDLNQHQQARRNMQQQQLPALQQRSGSSPEMLAPINELTGAAMQPSSGSGANAMGSPGNPLGQQAPYRPSIQGQAAQTSVAEQQATVAAIQQAISNQQQGADQSGQPAASSQSQAADQANSQLECDGHDKIGCYQVRVYYDWFLVNGSCKCWKTAGSQGGAGNDSGGNNSLLRRIFTG